MKAPFQILACFLIPLGCLSAARETRDFVMTVDGIEIPILIITPASGSGPFPVICNVHGGGWNGGTDTRVRPEAKFFSEELGIVYVGLAYRGRVQKGTFQLAMDDLRASIKWFESRAATCKAETSTVGFTGGSAGTPLSAMLTRETLGFLADGKGVQINQKTINAPFTCRISGGTIAVERGEPRESYLMQVDHREICKVDAVGRFAGNKEWHRKQGIARLVL